MPIDTSIYGLIRPQQITPLENPDDIALRRERLSALSGARELQNLQLGETRRGIESGRRIQDLFTQNPNATADDVARIDYGAAQKLKAAQAEEAAKKATTGKTNVEALEKSLLIHRKQLDDVANPQSAAQWVMAGFNDPNLSPMLQRYGSPQELIGRIPQDPAQFQEWRNRNAIGIEKVLADQRSRDTQTITMRGQDITDSSTRSEGAANRGVTMRGQDLTDQRSRDANAATQGNFAANTEGKLRDDYNKASQDFVRVRDAHQRVLASAKEPSAAGDLALIFNYMKVLDPGSTVREGEFATAQNSGGIPDRIRAQYNKAINGERLADSIRADFVDRSGRLYGDAEKNQEKLEEQYTEISKRSRADPRNVVAPQRVKQPTDAPPPPKLGERKDGYIFKGGNPADPKSWEKI